MNKRFERRLELAKNPRARKHHAKAKPKFVRAKSHVAAALHDMFGPTGYEDAPRGGRIYDPNRNIMAKNTIDALAAPLLAAEQLAIAAAMDGVDAVKDRMGKRKRMARLAKRRTYYAAERARSAEWREQICAARPEPTNPCPTPDELNEAYRRRRESEAWQLRFGTLMIDLEEHARREYAIAGNRFTGSAGGVKEWLVENCPILAAHYSTCQRYKRLAQDYGT